MPGSYDVVLRRRIESELGGRTIAIRDEVENLATTPAPLMLLYHVNLGYPLVGPDAAVWSRGAGAVPLFGTPGEPAGTIVPPAPDYQPIVYDHQVTPDAAGMCEA